MIEGFLLGIIVTGSATAAAFFYRFWRQTRDKLFLGIRDRLPGRGRQSHGVAVARQSA